MVVGIELDKQYIQVCVKTESMKDAESVSKIVGTEHYRMPVNCNIEEKKELQKLFQDSWKLLKTYGSKEALEFLVFCLEDNSEKMRTLLWEIVQMNHIPEEKVKFINKAESYCSYVFHQNPEFLSKSALLIENVAGEKKKLLLFKRNIANHKVAETMDLTEEGLEEVFKDYQISSVFLVGDDYEEEWIQENKKILKKGKRIFVGKNLFAKGACYRALDLKNQRQGYVYLGPETVSVDIGIKALQDGEEICAPVLEGGKNWYESDVSLEAILMDEPVLEFYVAPFSGKENKIVKVPLENLPVRPKKTTRLLIELKLKNPTCAEFKIKDLGFGELFPPTDMVYEGALQWDS